MAFTVKLLRKGAIKRRPDGSRHATIEYLIRSDDIDEDMDAIADHVDLPEQHVDAHPDNPFLICREVDTAEQDGSDFSYIVTAEFDTKQQFDQPEYNFAQERVEGGLRGYSEEVPAFVDGQNTPVINDAGDWFEGATKKKRMIAVPCTAYFQEIPWLLFTVLSNTVNNAAITIHGLTFPAGTAWLGDPQMPKKPIVGSDGASYWPVDYEIHIDLDGWYQDFPNRGYQAIQYQTRIESDPVTDPATYGEWSDVDWTVYDAGTDSNLKRFIKIRVTDDVNADTPQNAWLDSHGQYVRASLNYATGTVATTAGSQTATATFTPALDPDVDVGKRIQIAGAGLSGRTMVCRIDAISGTTLTLSYAAATTVASGAAKIGGVWVKSFLFPELADWTDLPLPNNETEAPA